MNYKELADTLQQPGPGTEAFYTAVDEAADILRRLDAAQGGVDGVMNLVVQYELCSYDHAAGAIALQQVRTAVEALALQSTPAPKEPQS